MKKIAISATLAAFALPGILSAATSATQSNTMMKQESRDMGAEQTATAGSMCNPTNWTLQARGAAFMPLKEELRHMFGSAEGTAEIESSYAIYKDKWTSCDQLLFWMNASWTHVYGHTNEQRYPAKLNLVPLSFGLTYQWNIVRNVDFYLGIGPTYSFLRASIESPFQKKHFNRGQFGFTTKTGFRFTFATNFFIDIFGDYYFTSFRKMHSNVGHIENNFSGFFVGGGFGGKW